MLLMHLSLYCPSTLSTGLLGAKVGVYSEFSADFAPRGWGLRFFALAHAHVHVAVSCARQCRARGKMEAEAVVEVLVGLETPNGIRNRPLKFNGQKSALIARVRERFADILPSDVELVLQIRDDSWGTDVYVDLLDQPIPDRAVIRLLIVEMQKDKVQVSLLFDHLHVAIFM